METTSEAFASSRMRVWARLVATAIVGGIIASGCGRAPENVSVDQTAPDVKRGLAELRGEWTLIAICDRGYKLDRIHQEAQLYFDGDKLRDERYNNDGDGIEETRYRVRLDPGKNPRWMDWVDLVRYKSVARQVYSIRGPRLFLAGSGSLAHPDSLHPDPPGYLVVYQRCSDKGLVGGDPEEFIREENDRMRKEKDDPESDSTNY